MTDSTNDIDALLRYLETGHAPNWYENSSRWHAALTALVAERDALRIEAQRSAKSYWRERAERRDAEQQSAADRDLRERLVCAALTGICADTRHDVAESVAVAIADRTLAAMRKGDECNR